MLQKFQKRFALLVMLVLVQLILPPSLWDRRASEWSSWIMSRIWTKPSKFSGQKNKPKEREKGSRSHRMAEFGLIKHFNVCLEWSSVLIIWGCSFSREDGLFMGKLGKSGRNNLIYSFVYLLENCFKHTNIPKLMRITEKGKGKPVRWLSGQKHLTKTQRLEFNA